MALEAALKNHRGAMKLAVRRCARQYADARGIQVENRAVIEVLLERDRREGK